MTPLSDFELTWTTLAERYTLVVTAPHEATLTGPVGAPLTLPREAWIALRGALAVLIEPTGPSASAGRPRLAPDGSSPIRPLERRGPPNRGRPWTDADELQLAAAFSEGKPPPVLALSLGRTTGAVLSRLVRLGLLDPEEASLRYPVKPVGSPAPNQTATSGP